MPRPRVNRSLILLLLAGCAGQPAPPPVPDAPAPAAAAPVEVAVEPVEVVPDLSTPAGVLAEYRALGLPLPPVSARFVRVSEFGQWPVVGFELGAGTTPTSFRLLLATAEREVILPARPREVPPNVAATRDAFLPGNERLALVAQCQSRGWDALAGHFLARYRAAEERFDVRQQLFALAWDYWEKQLAHPTADRRRAVAALKTLVRRDPTRDTPETRALMRSLDLALVPGTAKAGTAEALVHALVDKHLGLMSSAPAPDDPFWLLADRGFDAVPALIAALDDDRLTRARLSGRYLSVDYVAHLRVKHVVSDLIEGFATERLEREPADLPRDLGLDRVHGHAVTRAAAEAWLAKARAAGEEEYLVAHVMSDSINSVPLRAIAAKYPHRLPDLYRTVLAQRTPFESAEVAAALARSAVPAPVKCDLFAAAATHAAPAHRRPALLALKTLDTKRFDNLILAEVEALPVRSEDPGRLDPYPTVSVAQLAFLSDDPRVWTALAATARRSAVEQRGSLLFGPAGPISRWRSRPADRIEFVRLMVGFLDDQERFGDVYRRHALCYVSEQIEVRSLAAYELAWVLGMDFELKPNIPPEEWAKLRDEVRAAAQRELDPKK